MWDEINSYLIFIKDSEHQWSKFCGVPVWEKLCVDFDEPLFCEQTIWTVFQETLMPLSNLLLCNWKKIVEFIEYIVPGQYKMNYCPMNYVSTYIVKCHMWNRCRCCKIWMFNWNTMIFNTSTSGGSKWAPVCHTYSTGSSEIPSTKIIN